MVIDRQLLREEVRREVTERLLRGDYPVGTRINEVRLAAALGVSRTPLREALAALALEGLVESKPNRGFWLSPLTEREIRETYPIIIALETLALRSCDAEVLAEHADELIALADELAAAPDAVVAQKADDRWHERLLAPCENRTLLAMISEVKLVVHRYEHAMFGDPATLVSSAAQHRGIAEALAARELPRALELLAANWEIGMNRLVERIAL